MVESAQSAANKAQSAAQTTETLKAANKDFLKGN